MHYVIIGNSAAAVGAVEGIRIIDNKNPITIISDEPYHTYSRPLISYYLAGKVTEDQMLYRPRSFYQDCKVGIFLGRRADRIDTDNRKVFMDDDNTVTYDRLLIATGGKPFLPPVEGMDKDNVFTFLKWDDVIAIKEVVSPRTKAVVIGGGLIGLKAAEALTILGVQVTVVDLADRILSTILDAEAARIVQQKLEEKGIQFRLGTTVSTVMGEEKVTGVGLQDGSIEECGVLVFAIGVVPNTDAVRGTEVKTNRGIRVDERMRTNVKDVYAAGDAAEGYDILCRESRVLAILPNAYKQGEIAGLNMAGSATTFEGGFAFNSISFFDFPIVTAGLQDGQPSGKMEVFLDYQPERASYKKIFLRDNRLVGFIILNDVDRAGLLTGLVGDSVDVSEFKESLLKEDFGYVSLPKGVRSERLIRG